MSSVPARLPVGANTISLSLILSGARVGTVSEQRVADLMLIRDFIFSLTGVSFACGFRYLRIQKTPRPSRISLGACRARARLQDSRQPEDWEPHPGQTPLR